MGEIPITYTEVDAYMRLASSVSGAWEARTIVRMSGSYCGGKALGEDPFAVSPLEAFENDQG